MTRSEIIALGFVALAVTTAVSAHRAAASGSTVTPDAVAYHGAMQLYRNLACYFGQRALLAEAAYWKAVN